MQSYNPKGLKGIAKSGKGISYPQETKMTQKSTIRGNRTAFNKK